MGIVSFVDKTCKNRFRHGRISQTLRYFMGREGMRKFWSSWVQKWSSWIGDRDLELSLRRHLSDRGFSGDTARFENLRLAAVQRPGWVQVFVFTVHARRRGGKEEDINTLFGLVRQDERYSRLEICTYETRETRNVMFREWSSDLIRLRNSNP